MTHIWQYEYEDTSTRDAAVGARVMPTYDKLYLFLLYSALNFLHYLHYGSLRATSCHVSQRFKGLADVR